MLLQYIDKTRQQEQIEQIAAAQVCVYFVSVCWFLLSPRHPHYRGANLHMIHTLEPAGGRKKGSRGDRNADAQNPRTHRRDQRTRA